MNIMTGAKSMFFLGIDVSKAKLDCLLLVDGATRRKTKVVPNTAVGVQTLLDWCIKHGAQAAVVASSARARSTIACTAGAT
jgi:hypothetical protein